MKKIVNEEELFEDILADGFSRGGHPVFQELLVVAKHFRQTAGYGEINIVRKLAEFWEKGNEHFNLDLSETTLHKAARDAIKTPEFRKPNFPIYVSNDELKKIRKVKNFSYQKIIFSSLVMAKSSGNPQLFFDDNQTLNLIIEISQEKCALHNFWSKVSRQSYLFNIFEHVLGKHNFYSLIDVPEEDAGVAIGNMVDFYNSGDIYERHIGAVLDWCASCGREFKKNSGNHKRCKKCSKERLLEKTRKRVKKHRG